MKLPPPWPYPGPPPGVYSPLNGERYSYAGIKIQVHGQYFNEPIVRNKGDKS